MKVGGNSLHSKTILRPQTKKLKGAPTIMRFNWTRKGGRLRVFNRIRKYYSGLDNTKNEKFTDVPVDIDGTKQLFNFELLKDEDGRLWIANSKMYTLYIDEDFNYDNFSMPQQWVQPAIETLKKLLKEE